MQVRLGNASLSGTLSTKLRFLFCCTNWDGRGGVAVKDVSAEVVSLAEVIAACR